MDGAIDDYLVPPPRLFERLRQIPGYTWDDTKQPFHSSYDNWHVFGTKVKHERQITPITPNGVTLQSPKLKAGVPKEWPGVLTISKSSSSKTSDDDGGSETSTDTPREPAYGNLKKPIHVLAKISTHALREERAYHIGLSLSQSVDPAGNHIVRPVDHLRLPPQQGDKGPIVVSIFEAPGPNSLIKYIDFGPNGQLRQQQDGQSVDSEAISLPTFLDFAIGATECLELLHHGQRIVHGEIRGDAFHFDERSGQVRLINFGSGLRSFEHGLTSQGWSTLSKEVGAKTKLSFISPEQTGRMPAEPDSRTDIYSLGILFWTLLTRQPAFDGAKPMDIIQSVLGRRLPLVSSVRLDVPDVVGKIIGKMTAKDIQARYHSASGLRYDLLEVQKLLGDGNSDELKHFKIATKDVSSFFILPSLMIGRQVERDHIVKIIDKVAIQHLVSQKQSPNSLSSGSSPDTHIAPLEPIDDETQSDLTSSAEGQPLSNKSLLATKTMNASNTLSSKSTASSAANSQESVNSRESTGSLKPWERNTAIQFDAKGGSSSGETLSTGSMTNDSGSRISGGSDKAGGLNSKNQQKFVRKGRCEVISIAGAAGLGKSCLVQSVQVEARRRGYFASSKFDSARKTPFGPVLKLLSTLFKQVFAESQTDTPFHQLLKHYVRPVWPLLHKVLGLPEFLLGPDTGSNRATPSRQSNFSSRSSLRIEPQHQHQRSESSSSRSSPFNVTNVSQTPQDFLRAGSSTKSMRLMNTFLDVLRVFAQHKFLCFCLDDLQFADDESLELISQLISSKLKVVLIVTYRPEEMLPEKIKSIIQPSLAEGYIRSGGMSVTRIVLQPLTEDEITEYVAATLCRSKEDVVPLAAVVQSKSAGNPFYMREMLDVCNRKGCIYYNYRTSQWDYDLDRIFREFTAEDYHATLNGDFITRRLAELQPASRSILAWASLIGTSFSFELIQKLLSGEFDYDEDEELSPTTAASSPTDESPVKKRFTQQEIIAGLQAAIQGYIIITTEDDDKFRFAHDRYIQAASALKERRHVHKMNYIIACTLQKYYHAHQSLMETTASFICNSVDIIKRRVAHRQSFRMTLFESAQRAAENGARPTAVKFYNHCFELLQDDPWSDEQPDSYYDEALSLYVRAAECHHYMGHFEEARRLLDVVIERAKTPEDKSPAFVILSRIYAQEGDDTSTFQMLRICLASLGIDGDPNPTWESCDEEFDRLSLKIQGMRRKDPSMGFNNDKEKSSRLAAAGAVLTEIIGDAFWSDSLVFYSTSLIMANTCLTQGPFPQCGIAFMQLAIIAITRFSMLHFASEMGELARSLMQQGEDPFTIGRASTLYCLFVGHIQSPMAAAVGEMEANLEFALQSGDRLATILNFGVVAMAKFFSSDHLSELESFCQFGCEEVPNWQYDTRGGPMLIGLRQMCRSLEGKTVTGVPADVMCDESHNTTLYLQWLQQTCAPNSDRPILFYESLRLVPLFLYGHYEAAVDVGSRCIQTLDAVWSARNSRFVMLFYGLAKAATLLRATQDPSILDKSLQGPEAVELAKELRELRKKIHDWEAVNSVNYRSWCTLLDAQIAELEGRHDSVLSLYETSLDHASSNGFVLEEGLGNYLLAGYFLRRRAGRSAKSALREATTVFRQLGAVGVVRHMEDEHSMIFQGPTSHMRTMDSSTQTDFVADSAPVQYETMDSKEEEHPRSRTGAALESKADRIGAWQSGSARDVEGSGLPDLDMLDLTSILTSSQVISSVLQVDQLLKTMCDIILENCSGVASLAAIIVEEDDPQGWSIAASGESGDTSGAVSHMPGLPLAETSMVASSVVLYCTRFRESVFLPDLIHDERFSNVADAWWSKNPQGKSVIAIPIAHGGKPLLGVLYLEGQPNAFTDRNLTVLQLLVNQIGISYSNALTLKAIEKVSASNVSMVESQKRALSKAKRAEAEAIRNYNLAQDAAKAKSIFLANVSHELRTPLNGVIGNSELLKDSGLNQEQSEMADSIRVSADLLLTVINDILDFSKMEADKMKLFIVAFKADEMLREVVRSFTYSNRDRKGRKDVEIKQDFELPSILIYGDPVRLHQVLGNLIGNSLKFTEKGSITVGARMDHEFADAVQITFWVKDTGIGIPPTQIKKLFTPFSQVDTSTARKYGGSGLGLSICKSLVENIMKGKISLESVEGEGTTVWFTITFRKAVIPEANGDGHDSQPDPMSTFIRDDIPFESQYHDFSDIARRDLRICIAEDNLINQKIAIQFVKKLGFVHVDAYENGQAAVDGLRAQSKEGQPYHLVLMDVQMPILDGYEATKLIRRDPDDAVRHVLVIAMTASAIQGDREKCLESGMNDYLAKPVRVHVLKKKLEQYLNQRPATMTNLQEEANKLAEAVMKRAANNEITPTDSSRASVAESRSADSDENKTSTVKITLQEATPLSKPDDCVDYFEESNYGKDDITQQMSDLALRDHKSSDGSSDFVSDGADQGTDGGSQKTPSMEDSAHSSVSRQIMDEDMQEAMNIKVDGIDGTPTGP